jgi:transketolase
VSRPYDDIDQLAINTLRTLAVDAVEQAKSGHPGLPLGAAPMAHVLWTRYLRHNPADPSWPGRDRFVLSAGHGCMLLYGLLHLTGYDLPLDELKRFRQWGSLTPGHPEHGHTPGVEATTGPLGQGTGNAVGMAIAGQHLAARYGDAAGFRVFALVSDGDLMEGVSGEVSSLAGHLELDNLVFLYDDNHVTIDGDTELAFTEDRVGRYAAYGWHTQTVDDGNDLDAIDAAIADAIAHRGQPSFIAVKTIIGYGSVDAGTSRAHSDARGAEQQAETKRALGFDPAEYFVIPEQVSARYREALSTGAEQEEGWKRAVAGLPLAAEYERIQAGDIPELVIEPFDGDEKPMATRAASGKVIAQIADQVPQLLGGSADLTPSNNTKPEGWEDFQPGAYAGRYLRFGVREHGMSAVSNGLAAAGLRPYAATFFNFLDYAKPAVRLSALSRLPVIWIYTHDSVGLGEDGPTHQPIEQLATLRATPDVCVFRPADANETIAGWRVALARSDLPTALVLSRQALPVLDPERYPIADAARGGYVLEGDPEPDVVLIGTGSEVHVALAARSLLRDRGVSSRVVSLPSWELFEEQPEAYRNEVLPPEIEARVSVEAAATLGWERYVGLHGAVIGLDRFGASAPGTTVLEKLGFTPEHVADEAERVLQAASIPSGGQRGESDS